MHLPIVSIPTPCPEDWDSLDGDERSRRCARCELHVTNLAELTDGETRALLASAHRGQRVCVRVGRDAAGAPVNRTTRHRELVAALSAFAARRPRQP